MAAARSWTENYYDAMAHFAWAPEQLDHLSNPKRAERGRASPNQTVERLRRIEVPLNHLLAFFFSLAPASIVSDLFAKHCQTPVDDDVRYLGRAFEREKRLDSVTQPDFVFENDNVFLTVETKVGSQSSLEQLQKYAYVHAKAREGRTARKHGLIFLTPYSEQQLFGHEAKSIAEARRKAAATLVELAESIGHDENAAPLSGPVKSTLRKVAAFRAAREMLELDEQLAIGHCTFGQFVEIVADHCTKTLGSSVEARLYSGLMAELNQRKLAI